MCPNPLDRAYYSGNPGFIEGADQTAEVEALLDPTVADALDTIHEARLGRIKYAGETAATQMVVSLNVLEGHLAPTGAPIMQGQLSRVNAYLTEKITETRTKREAKAQEDNIQEGLKRMPLGSRLVAGVYTTLRMDKKPVIDLVTLVQTYTTNPMVLSEAVRGLDGLKSSVQDTLHEYGRDENALDCVKRTRELVIGCLAQQPLPLFTAAPKDTLALMGRAYFEMNQESLAERLPEITRSNTVSEDTVSVVTGMRPGNLEAAIICAQFINTLARVKTPGEATKMVNHIFGLALDHGHEPGAENLLDLLNMTFRASRPELMSEYLQEFDVRPPAARLDPRNYYRFLALLQRDRIHHENMQNDPFFEASSINFAVMGKGGIANSHLGELIEKADERYGLTFRDEITTKEAVALQAMVKEYEGGQDTIRGFNFSTWHHRAQEMRYDKHHGAQPDDMLLSPRETFAKHAFAKQGLGDPLDRMHEDYQSLYIEHRLSHRGYFNTVAELLAFNIEPERYADLRDEIDELRTDIFVNGDYFISPRGDQFVIDDKQLKGNGLRSITYEKQANDRRSTRVTLEFYNAKIGCVITPDMELLSDRGEPLILRKDLAEPLEYLTFGYLQALKCRPETITETHPKEISDSQNESFVRRAHMRRLPPGHTPDSIQIDLAAELEDFDVVDDNRSRAKRGLPIRTYVQESIIDPEKLDPNLLKARVVARRLRQLASQK